jgi:hypothetical protein
MVAEIVSDTDLEFHILSEMKEKDTNHFQPASVMNCSLPTESLISKETGCSLS